jgi:hypothetical protein
MITTGPHRPQNIAYSELLLRKCHAYRRRAIGNTVTEAISTTGKKTIHRLGVINPTAMGMKIATAKQKMI